MFWLFCNVYEIQQIEDVRRAAGLKAGGVGQRYTCVVKGESVHWENRIYMGKIVHEKDN